MKKHCLLKFLAVWWLVSLARGSEVRAADFELLVTRSPDPVVVNQELNFTIDVTNQTGFTVNNIVITNLFPASAQFISASNSFGGGFTNAGVVRLQIDFLTNKQPARVVFAIRPTVLGDLTNTTSVGAFGFTNTTTNVTTRVVSGIADLVVGIIGPPPGVLVNDLITYTVGATNRGLDAVPDVMLTNSLPPELKLISVNPTNATVSFTNGTLLFSLGTLASNAFASFLVTVQPTNAGDLLLLAGVNAAGVFDPNASNNFATNIFNVGSFLTGQLVASISSTQQYNPQTGLMEQRITLSNTGATAVAAARVIVQGLSPTNRLFNAVGTNSANPFVVYATNLAAGASVDLVLEYFVSTRVAVPDPTLVAVEVTVFNPAVPSGTPVSITRLIILPTGRVLLEFPSETNRNYTVLYCNDATFSNQTLVARPTITAPADRVQWIDYGPPKTISHPASTTSRFYRVIASP